MITIKKGDLLEADETIIGHQVNCCGAAGGLAAAVFKKWPEAAHDYYLVVERIREAGGQGFVMLGKTQLCIQHGGKIIANIYGQYYAGQDYRPDVLRMALESLAVKAKAMKASVALPWRLSCGICGGDWDEVLPMIEETMRDVNCTIYRRDQDE